MKLVFCVALSLISHIDAGFEPFNEAAWLDNRARDKYFEYSDVAYDTVADTTIATNYSNNVDTIEFKKTSVALVEFAVQLQR